MWWLHPYPWLAVLGAGLLFQPWLERRGPGPRAFARATGALALVVFALAWDPWHGAGRWILAGMVLAGLGDVMASDRGDAGFVGAQAFFFAAHVSLAVGLAYHGLEDMRLGLAMGAVLVVVAAGMAWLWPHVVRSHRPGTVSSALAASAASAAVLIVVSWAQQGPQAGTAGALGAVFLAGSHLAAWRDELVVRSPWNGLANRLLLYAALVALVWLLVAPT